MIGTGVKLTMALVVALLAAGLFVRGLEPLAAEEPGERATPEEEKRLVPEPMQLLRANSRRRLAELDPFVDPDVAKEWTAARNALFTFDDCPELAPWLESGEGQHFERLLTGLQRGSREEALGALALIFQVARSCDWSPGYFGGAAGSERLGGLLRGWLGDWAEEGVQDPLLYEPTLAAVLLYGKVMHTSYRGNWISDNDSSLDRARTFLARLLGDAGEHRTRLALALEARFPGTLAEDPEDEEFLDGFEREAELAFPDLTGECD